MRVLLVEDDEKISRRVSRALSNLFKDYVVIRDSSEGLKVYGKKQFLISLKMNIGKEQTDT